jgi:hypothetical protein
MCDYKTEDSKKSRIKIVLKSDPSVYAIPSLKNRRNQKVPAAYLIVGVIPCSCSVILGSIAKT